MLTAEPVARCGASKPCVDASDREILGMVGDSFTFLKNNFNLGRANLEKTNDKKKRVFKR